MRWTFQVNILRFLCNQINLIHLQTEVLGETLKILANFKSVFLKEKMKQHSSMKIKKKSKKNEQKTKKQKQNKKTEESKKQKKTKK